MILKTNTHIRLNRLLPSDCILLNDLFHFLIQVTLPLMHLDNNNMVFLLGVPAPPSGFCGYAVGPRSQPVRATIPNATTLPEQKNCPKTNAFPVIFHRACMRRFHSKMQTPDNDETLFFIISLFDDTIVVLLMSNNQSRRNDQNEILYIFFYEQNAEHGRDPMPRSS